jgi:branched-chain amino acid transport system permease protein
MAIEPEVQWIIYGVLMVAVVYFLPRGIVPAIEGYFSGRKQLPTLTASRAPQK